MAELSARTDKPIVVVSSTGEALHPDIKAALAGTDVPLLRGLRPAVAAMACMETSFGRIADPRRIDTGALSAEKAALRAALGAATGPLPGALTARLLTAYDLPTVRSAVVAGVEEAVVTAAELGYPLVVKVVSRDVPHRSEVGAVRLGIHDETGLRDAVTAIAASVAKLVPGAVIEGYELQEELSATIEAVVGSKATPPFGALIMVGTGGTLVELQDDRAVSLCPVTATEATWLIGSTRLGTLLQGYRGLIPVTELAPIVALITKLSELAADMSDVLTACDLNPVLVQPGSGVVRIVDALFIASGQTDAQQR